MTRKSYSKYKDSGIKWLGRVPEHWSITRFKYGIDIIESGKRDLVEYSNVLSIGGEHIGSNHQLNLKNLKYVSEDFYNQSKKGRVHKGDILIVKDGATIGKTAYVDENQLKQKMLLNEHVYRVAAHKYIYYFVLSSFFQSKVWSEDNSSAQEGLNLSTIKNIPLLEPSRKEQKAIAGFLDKETSRIDFLAQKKERQIELLREKRSALIAQAVTRGLGPKAKMRDSGIKWLGKIPAHWEVKRLKFLLSRNEGGIWGESFDDNGATILRSTEQTVDGLWNINDPAKRKISPFEHGFYRLMEGDLVITKSSGSSLHIGKTSIVTKEIENMNCCYSNFMQRIRGKKGISPGYLWYVLNGEIGREQFNFFSTTTTGLSNLNSEIIGMIAIAFPAFKEQKAIAGFLDKETSRIDLLIEKIKKSIKLLKEWRAALIASAVTGRIDVRESQ